jgi:putative ABC transport system ATP-binding protein
MGDRPLLGTQDPLKKSDGRSCRRTLERAFSWSADSPIVIDIESLRIANAERIFLRGPSGSGKSTLLSLLAGISRPNEGSLQVLGQDMATLGGAARDRFRADHIGFIFQMFNSSRICPF